MVVPGPSTAPRSARRSPTSTRPSRPSRTCPTTATPGGWPSNSASRWMAATHWGEYGRRLALLGEAEALARALDDRARLGQVLAQMATVLRMTGDLDGAIAAGQQALDLAAALGESALQVQASHHLGQACYFIGDFGRRPSSCGGTWRLRTGRLARPGSFGHSGVAGADLERARGIRRGPAPRGGGAPPRHAGRPRETDRSLSTAASATCTSPKGTWSTPSRCWSRAWPSVVPPATERFASDHGGPGLCLCAPGTPRRGVRTAGGGDQGRVSARAHF